MSSNQSPTIMAFQTPDSSYFKSKVPGIPNNHPINNEKNHNKLLNHIQQRILFSLSTRDSLAGRFANIDKELAGFQVLDYQDRQRLRDNQRGRGPKPIETNLQLTQMQLDEQVTYLMNVFAPDDGMYKAVSSKDKQNIANGFALALNQHAAKFQHYRNLSMGFMAMLKYNLGGWETEWREVRGTKLKNKGGTKLLQADRNATLYKGNALKAIDMYNFFFDVSVDPVDLPLYGEYYATVDAVREFQLQQMEARGEVIGTFRFLGNNLRGYAAANAGSRLWKAKPTIRQDGASEGGTGSTNWDKFWAAGGYGTLANVEVSAAYEKMVFTGWINPSEFGLSKENMLQIWRIKLINCEYIVHAEYLNNAHGMLPVGIGRPVDDEMRNETKSYAEMLLPLQRFASFLINIHQKSARKSLFGIKLYNPNVVDLTQLYKDDGDGVAGMVAARASSYDFDLTKAVHELRDAPDTQWTMRDFGAVLEIMQRFLPTDMLRQVADLERATLYQAAATVQSGNRRSLKMAKTLNDQALNSIRFQMMYNTFQYGDEVNIIDPTTGAEVKADPAEFRDTNIEFDISDGLKSIDKLMTMNIVMDMLKTLVQTPEAYQEVDIIGLLSHYTSQFGDKTDLSQFRRRALPPTGEMTPEQQQQALAAQQGNAAAQPGA